MRFSSDEQFFEENNSKSLNNKESNLKTPVKKEKKQTMLSKFLSSITSQILAKMLQYEKLKRPIFQRRGVVPQKISLYEDILLITIFKQNQSQIQASSLNIKTLCIDLQTRTKRRQCTIRQRIQKKLCKLRIQEIIQHISRDKDISFNSRRQYSTNHSQHLLASQKKSSTSSVKHQPLQPVQVKSQPLKQQSQKIFQQPQQPLPQNPLQLQDQSQKNNQNLDILISVNKNEINIFCPLLIERQLDRLRQQQCRKMQRKKLTEVLLAQMSVIQQFKGSAARLRPQVQQLVNEAERIAKLLGLTNVKLVNHEDSVQEDAEEDSEIHFKDALRTADKKIDQNTDLALSLCQNEHYIQLYKSDPTTFQPLIWTGDEDMLIDSLIDDFQNHQNLFKLLIRYKGPEMFVERCWYLNKKINNETKFFEEIEKLKPLNLNKIKQKDQEIMKPELVV